MLYHYKAIIVALSKEYKIHFYRPHVETIWISVIVGETTVCFTFSGRLKYWKIDVERIVLPPEVKEDMRSSLGAMLMKTTLDENCLLKTFKRFVPFLENKLNNSCDAHETKDSKSNSSTNSAATQKKNITIAAVFPKPVKNPGLSQRLCDTRKDSSKKPSMKTAEDVINRIIWDKSLDENYFTVAYEDRFTGTIEKHFSEFNWDIPIASAGPDIFCIPQHRIQYFKFKNRVVWDKECRLDDFFGSTGSGTAIHDVMVQEEKEFVIPETNEVDESTFSKTLFEVGEYQFEEEIEKPNFFIAVNIDSTIVQKCVAAYHKKILKTAQDQNIGGVLQPALISQAKLHISLCVCRIKKREELEIAKQVLEDLVRKSKSFEVKFDGIDHFGLSVTYAKVISPEIEELCSNLRNSLEECGIYMQDNRKNFIPHMTLVKFKPGTRPDSSVRSILHKEEHQRWNFKSQIANKVMLAEIRSTAEGGSYKTYALCNLIPLASNATQEGKGRAVESRDVKSKRSKKSRKRAFDREQNDHESSANDRNIKKHDVQLGKALSAVLRHNKFGFSVDAEGYIPVEKILQDRHFSVKFGATVDDIHRVVSTNDKQRFHLKVVDGIEMIRANQGHTVEVSNLDLKELTDPEEYPTVVHGTFWNFWEKISSKGLHRRKRNHIHMTTAIPSNASQPISGMRKSCSVFIYIDLRSAMTDGIKFFVSSNGVILTPGDDQGYLPTKYFSRVEGVTKKQRVVLLSKSDDVQSEAGPSFESDLKAAGNEESVHGCNRPNLSQEDCIESSSPKNASACTSVDWAPYEGIDQCGEASAMRSDGDEDHQQSDGTDTLCEQIDAEDKSPRLGASGGHANAPELTSAMKTLQTADCA